MTEAELLAALEDATRRTPGGEGMTVTEICEATGANQGRVRKLLAKGLQAGRVSRSAKLMESISGRMVSIPSYLFRS